MTNQSSSKAKVVQVKPTWLERFAQWAGITSHSAFVGWTAKMLGAYVTITMAYEKKLDQALLGLIIALLGELIMLMARQFDACDTLKQVVNAQPTKAAVKLEAKLTIDGRDLVSSTQSAQTVTPTTETDRPQNQDNPVTTPQ